MGAPLLLVHGAWHGAWCYSALTPELSKLGVSATAIDLPGHGQNGKPGWGVGLEDYARATVFAARATGGPVHAVGHSMGGLVIARAAELAPDAFASLVFLAAFLPRNGDNLRALGAEDGASSVPNVTSLNLLAGRVDVLPAKAPSAFYNTCSPDQILFAATRLQNQSARPLLDAARVSDARFGAVKRTYLACRQDRAITFDFQNRMLARIPCAAVETLDTDHSPFLCQPAQTAAALARLTQ